MFECSLENLRYKNIVMAHGNGGRLTDELIQNIFKPCFGETDQHDGARVDWQHDNIIITTDSFVVNPMFFPGGDIGKLAIYGTINDLAMCAAKPEFLSIAFILEEGLPLSVLAKICQSIAKAANDCNVRIVTGDTKVIEKGDGMFINTTGIGFAMQNQIGPSNIRDGDAIIINRDLGKHAMAIMAARHELNFTPPIESDCSALFPSIMALLNNEVELHCARDITRGGLASILNELAEKSGLAIVIEQEKIPIDHDVHAACELLGLNSFQLASEGCFIAFVPEDHASKACNILAKFNENSQVIGKATKEKTNQVTIVNSLGIEKILLKPLADNLPRIC